MELHTFNNDKSVSSGLEVSIMVKMIKILEKIGFKTIEDLMKANPVLLKEWEVKTSPHDIIVIDKKNKIIFIDNEDDIYEIFNKKETCFISRDYEGRICLGKSVEGVRENQKKVKEKYKNIGISEKEKKAINWLDCGEIGTSSLSLCKVLFPNIKHPRLDNMSNKMFHPIDPSDLRRCVLFLEHCEITNLLDGEKDKIRNISKGWSELINNWDKLMEVFNEERNNKSAPKTYDLMQELIEEKLNNKKIKP